jgi:NAD(P)-dependent dehydrogenase (short-subunit alcohol dehydrogenase family)
MDRFVLITGATAGIGYATAAALARLGATVLVHGRSPESAGRAAADLRAATGSPSLVPVSADLASLRQVRALAADVLARFDRLDVLINNAGVYLPDRRLTEDGFETTYAVNHLAHFLLTRLLLERLQSSRPARIINVSSMLHAGGRLDDAALRGQGGPAGGAAYAASKLANVLFTYELAGRLDPAAVTANCLHPGVIDTQLLRTGFGGGGDRPEAGAETPVYLASAPELAGVSGRYYVRRREAEPAALSRDARLRRALWDASEAATGLAAESGDSFNSTPYGGSVQ